MREKRLSMDSGRPRPGTPEVMTNEREEHSITPDDAKPSGDADDYREITAPETDQDPVEEPDADREPGPGKS